MVYIYLRNNPDFYSTFKHFGVKIKQKRESNNHDTYRNVD